jgi:hypothetical protein
MFWVRWRNTGHAGVEVDAVTGDRTRRPMLGSEPKTSRIEDTGDYNGDGKSDILWRDIFGDVMIWFIDGAIVTSTADLGRIPVVEEIQTAHVD